MKISYNWLQNYLDLSTTSVEAIAEMLPLLGFDVESIERLGPPQLEHVVVGEVVEYAQHPNADRLRCCKVRTGLETPLHSIVCGAKNFEAGDKVMVALPGAILPGNFKIKKSKLRGEPSEGMLCSAKELQLGQDHAGILIVDAEQALGRPLNQVFSDCDTVLNLEVTPNRVDVLSHIGTARELAARLGCGVRYPQIHSSRVNASSGQPLLREIEVKAAEACPHYTAQCIRGVEVKASPKWLKAAVEAIGLRSINNVVDVTNYVLHETGQPLHAFDAGKIQGEQLQVRFAQPQEQITTLDEKQRSLSEDMLVIADAHNALVVAGVMGSQRAEVDLTTTDIVLESAYFEPSQVRATSRKLGLSSDSAYRFERGVDPQGIEYARQRAADLILEVAGGRLDGDCIEVGSAPVTCDEIELRPQRVRQLLGFELSDDAMQQALEAIELKVSVHTQATGADRWIVGIPSFRGDLQREIDLVEEIVRIYGTDKIPASSVEARGICHADHRVHAFKQQVAQDLCGQNFDEALLYSLRAPEEVATLFGDEAYQRLTLANPLQSDQSHLRPSLIPGLLDVLKLNQARGTEATRFYERGQVFRAANGQVSELISVAFVLLADPVRREWRVRESGDFYTARSLCEGILSRAGIAPNKLNFEPIDACELWQPGHAAEAGDWSQMGYSCTAGLLKLDTVKARWGIEHRVIAGSVLMTPAIFKRKMSRARYQALSNQPASVKDLALMVDASTLAAQVERDLAKFAKKACQGFVCEQVRIFDVYGGSGLPEGQKSLALSLRFRAQERTLKEKEVNAAFELIQKMIADKTPYVVRK